MYPQEHDNWVTEHPFAGTPEFKNWFGQVVYCPDKLQCGDFVANFVCQDGHGCVARPFRKKNMRVAVSPKDDLFKLQTGVQTRESMPIKLSSGKSCARASFRKLLPLNIF